MILSRTPVSMSEVKEVVKELDGKDALKDYLKTFSKLSKDKAHKMQEEIRALNNPKIKEEDIIKIVDFLPKDSQQLAVIFRETTLNEEESNALLKIVEKQ